MKPDKHSVAAAWILLTAACLIALIWVGTMRTIRAQQAETIARATASLANQALTLTEQIDRQILGFDQTLRIIADAWETDPKGFDLETWRKRATVLTGLSRDMILTDENGIVRQSSVVDAINQNDSELDYFRALADPSEPGDQLFLGSPAIDGIMRQWHMNAARALHRPDGSFAGVIDADYRLTAITDTFGHIDLGPGAFIALVGLDDGKLRGEVSTTSVDPDASVGDTAMFAAIQEASSGIWTGPSAIDAVRRIHAYHHIAGRRLAVVAGMDEAEALLPAVAWRRQTEFFAGCATAALAALALALVQGTRLARRQQARIAEAAAELAASNAQFEVARAVAETKVEQLEAALAGLGDGVAVVDPHLCLVEWNALFPQRAGIPGDILRVGLPIEEVLRAQIKTGEFGLARDVDAEVERRMTALRSASASVAHWQRPSGQVIEVRNKRSPDGGLVIFYADITERQRAEATLRSAQSAAEAARAEKSRFAAIVSHALQTRLDTIQRRVPATGHRPEDALSALAGDVLDFSRMESGTLTISPSEFELRPLLESCAAALAPQAAERGVSIQVAIAEGTPPRLFTDPARLRQVQANLLSRAVEYAASGTIWLLAEPGHTGQEAVRLTIKDEGPVIAPEMRDGPAGDEQVTDLGPTICRHLVALMGGQTGIEPWRSESGREGNAFWLALPGAVLPYRPIPEVAEPVPPAAPGQRALPRTRVLLISGPDPDQLGLAALLRREGHHVEAAGGTQAAVEMLKKSLYDVVLADIIMPRTGEEEPTQAIRALPEPARSIPIVALTSTGNEETCREAGMDGVLGKPVLLAGLNDALRTHVWARALPASEPAVAVPDAHSPDAPPALLMDRINELRTALPPETFANLVEECLLDLEHRLPALRRALVARAPGAVAAHAHALIGMAGGYGMRALELRLRTMMNAAREGDLSPLGATAVADLERDVDQASTSLRAMLGREIA